MVFGRPFIDETGLAYNEEEGTVVFKQDDEKIMFKMPRTMNIFKQTRLMGLYTDSIPLSAYEENFSHGRTHYTKAYSLDMSTNKTMVIGEELGIQYVIISYRYIKAKGSPVRSRDQLMRVRRVLRDWVMTEDVDLERGSAWFESHHGPSRAEINRSVAVRWRKHSLPLDQPLKSAYFAYDLRIKYAYHNCLGGR
ncbi:hypothetical protein Tco_0373509 [Tanacetum coccineum]